MSTILHLSALYAEEGWAPEGSAALDFTDIEGTNCYCSPAASKEIRRRLGTIGSEGLCWIDTGDYHYVSLLRMEFVGEPFALVLLDHHPDDQPSALGAGLLSCGGWVQNARETLPMMKKDYLNTSVIPSDIPVFLSIDLDVLSREYARTDWDQGSMTLPRLLETVGRIRAEHRILGIDVCGGITTAKGATAEDFLVNARTRAVLEQRLPELL